MRIRPWAATAALCLLLGATGCTTNTGNQTAGYAGNAARNATNWAGNTAGNAGRVTGNAVQRTGNVAGNVVGGAGNVTGNVVRGTGNVASNVVGGTGTAAGNAVRGAGNVAGNIVGGAGRLAGDVVRGTGTVVGGGVAGLAGAAGTAVNRTGQALTGNNYGTAGNTGMNGTGANALRTVSTFNVDAPNKTVHIWLSAASDWTGAAGTNNRGTTAAGPNTAAGAYSSAAVRNGTSAGYTAGVAGTTFTGRTPGTVRNGILGGATVGGTGTVQGTRFNGTNTAGLGTATAGSYSAINRGPAGVNRNAGVTDLGANWGRYSARADGTVEHSGTATVNRATGTAGYVNRTMPAGGWGRGNVGTAGMAGAAGYAGTTGVNGPAVTTAVNNVSSHVPMTITVPRGWNVHVTVNNLRNANGTLVPVTMTYHALNVAVGAKAGPATPGGNNTGTVGTARAGNQLRSAGGYAGAYMGRQFVDQTHAQQAAAIGSNTRALTFQAVRNGSYVISTGGQVLETVIVNGSQNGPTFSTR